MKKKDYSEFIVSMTIIFLCLAVAFLLIDLRGTIIFFFCFLASGFTLFLEKEKNSLLKENEEVGREKMAEDPFNNGD